MAAPADTQAQQAIDQSLQSLASLSLALSKSSSAAGLSPAEFQRRVLDAQVSMIKALVIELAAGRQYKVPITIKSDTATSGGTGFTTSLAGSQWRLVYARAHFTGGSGTAAMTIALDSGVDAAYDTVLYTTQAIGTGADLNLRISDAEAWAWTFQDGDALVFTWADPDTTVYGLEVGLMRA